MSTIIKLWAVAVITVIASARPSIMLNDTRADLELYRHLEVKYTPRKPMSVVAASREEKWLLEAGIPYNDWPVAKELVQRESSWNPQAINPSSGACGLGQQLPCGKWAGQWDNPIDSLKAMDGYVRQRYGGWSQALGFHSANGWY